MSASPRQPLRILVKGSSLVVMTPETPTAEGDYTFPRLVQNRLIDRGRTVEMDNRGVAGDTTRAGLRSWEAEVMSTAPDVAIYGYAYYECIHALLPRRLERHVNSRRWRGGTIRTRYRSWILRPTWKVLAQSQRVLDTWIQDRFFRRRVRRIIADYELLVRRTRTYVPGRPLVLVLALLGPGGEAGGWFPGMATRISAMNRALEEMVDRINDPDVRLVPVPELAQRLATGEDPVPDGMHYSPRMRRDLSDWLAAEIDAFWVQRHR